MLPAEVQALVVGLYSSALASQEVLSRLPPVTRISPLWSVLPVWPARGSLMLPAAVQLSVAGSYSSAVEMLPLYHPPATRIWPVESTAAVCR
jgi:hypothetical protein